MAGRCIQSINQSMLCCSAIYVFCLSSCFWINEAIDSKNCRQKNNVKKHIRHLSGCGCKDDYTRWALIRRTDQSASTCSDQNKPLMAWPTVRIAVISLQALAEDPTPNQTSSAAVCVCCVPSSGTTATVSDLSPTTKHRRRRPRQGAEKGQLSPAPNSGENSIFRANIM